MVGGNSGVTRYSVSGCVRFGLWWAGKNRRTANPRALRQNSKTKSDVGGRKTAWLVGLRQAAEGRSRRVRPAFGGPSPGAGEPAGRADVGRRGAVDSGRSLATSCPVARASLGMGQELDQVTAHAYDQQHLMPIDQPTGWNVMIPAQRVGEAMDQPAHFPHGQTLRRVGGVRRSQSCMRGRRSLESTHAPADSSVHWMPARPQAGTSACEAASSIW